MNRVRVNLNDLDLETCMREIHRAHEPLDRLMRDGEEAGLFIALSNIEKAAYRAQERLNKLRYGK